VGSDTDVGHDDGSDADAWARRQPAFSPPPAERMVGRVADIPQVVLWGADHPQRGSVELAGIDQETAIALSAGLYPKPYASFDPNEDVVFTAVGQRWRLLAVADGHYGCDAAAGAVRGLQMVVDRLDGAVDLPSAGVRLLADAAITGVRHAIRRADTRRRESRTALTIVLIGPQAMHICQWGDTAALRVRGDKAKLLAPPGHFLSPAGEPPKCVAVRVRADDRVVVVSDGVTDYLGRQWVRQIGHTLGAHTGIDHAARALVKAAFAGGAGDHVAVGVMFAGPGSRRERPRP
jgi:serine/threonine protein phosphatase PrpC